MSESTNQCAKCNNPMKVGFVMDKAHYSHPSYQIWVEGEPEESFWSGFKTTDKELRTVDKVLRCTSCGYLEYYAVSLKYE